MTNNTEMAAMATISSEGLEMLQETIAYHVKDIDAFTALDLTRSITLIIRSERLKAAVVTRSIDNEPT